MNYWYWYWAGKLGSPYHGAHLSGADTVMLGDVSRENERERASEVVRIIMAEKYGGTW